MRSRTRQTFVVSATCFTMIFKDYKISNDAASALVQSIRVLGCYNDDIPITLYSKQSDIVNIRKTLAIQDRLIQGCLDHDSGGILRDLYTNVEVYTDVVPKRRLCVKERYRLNQIVRPDDELKSDGTIYGSLSFKNHAENGIYNSILRVMTELQYTCWTGRGQIMKSIPQDGRNWDYRRLHTIQYEYNDVSKIEWRKVNGNYEYRLKQ